MYSYKCPEGHLYEEIRPVADRHNGPACPECGKDGTLKITPVRLDSRMMTPSATEAFRKAAIRRGMGLDMTAANRRVNDESIDRNAFEQRKRSGHGKVTTH